MTTATQVTRMTSGQIADSAEVQSRAFFDDPMMVYILPDESKRMRQLEWFMGCALRYGERHGEVYTTGSQVDGNAIWLPPGEQKISTMRMIRAGMLAAPLRLGMGAFGRFMTLMDHLEKLHERDMPERHWYLMVLGVDPPRQGQGVGGALIAPIVARADAEGLGCYLETMKPRNVTFYQKHGFEVVVEEDAPKGGPHLWTMKRPARA